MQSLHSTENHPSKNYWQRKPQPQRHYVVHKIHESTCTLYQENQKIQKLDAYFHMYHTLFNHTPFQVLSYPISYTLHSIFSFSSLSPPHYDLASIKPKLQC